MIAEKALLEEFVSHLRNEKGLSPQTAATYRHHLRGYTAFLRDHSAAPAAAQTDVSAYLGHLRARELRPTTSPSRKWPGRLPPI